MDSLNTSMEKKHYPVMLEEVIKISSPENGGNFLDCTFGGGGYSKEILKYPKTKVVAIDRDKSVEKEALFLKKKFSDRFSFYHSKFSNIDNIIKSNDINTILFDLGISSIQLADFDRGFSFKSNNKLDMSMGLSSLSASDVLNKCDEKNLKLIFKIFGEEKEASKIAKKIIKFREKKKFILVKDLVEIIRESKKKYLSRKIDVSTQTFQALRIFVNKETTELISAIIKASKLIKSGGKIIIISFHSIEDKIIKFFFSNYSKGKSNPSRYLPSSNSYNDYLFDNEKNFFLRPSSEEIKKNPKSRSAKLRYAVRSNKDFYYPKEMEIKFKKYLDLEKIDV